MSTGVAQNLCNTSIKLGISGNKHPKSVDTILQTTILFRFIVTLVLLGVVAFCWACKRAKNAIEPERCCQEIRPRVQIGDFVMEATRQEQEPPSYNDAVAKIGGMYIPPPDYYSATTQQ